MLRLATVHARRLLAPTQWRTQAVRHLGNSRAQAAAIEAAPSVESTLRRFGVSRVRPWLASALRTAGFVEPYAVQGASMERIAKHEHTVVHAETGSGKTLAYLVPILSRLEPGLPLQLLVLLPSRELALQVASEIDRLLVPPAPLNVALVVGGAGEDDDVRIQQALAAEVAAKRAEVLVGTPHAVRRALHSGERAKKKATPRFDDDGRYAGRSARELYELGGQFDFDLKPTRAVGSGSNDGGGGDHGGVAVRGLGGYDYFGAQAAGTDSANLLLAISSNLDAIVLDEVDALLPKPLLTRNNNQKVEQMAFFRQVDWAKASRNERLAHRPGGAKSSPAAKLVRRILHAVDAARSVDVDGWKAVRFTQHISRERWEAMEARRRAKQARRKPVQLVAASATVGRNVLEQLKVLFKLNSLPAVVGAHGVVRPPARDEHGQSATARMIAQLKREGKRTSTAAIRAGERTHGARGVAGVHVPSTIQHCSLAVADAEDQPRALRHAIDTLRPRVTLAVLPDDTSLEAWRTKLAEVGLPGVKMLHEAMGFPTRRSGGRAVNATASELLSMYRQGSAIAPAAAEDITGALKAGEAGEAGEGSEVGAAAQEPVLLLTTERSVRGLDLPDLDCVAMLFVPLTSDAYVHLAGRTGRSATHGTALTLVPAAEVGRLGLFTSQLGIKVRPMQPPEWLQYGLAQIEAQKEEQRRQALEAARELATEEKKAMDEAEALIKAARRERRSASGPRGGRRRLHDRRRPQRRPSAERERDGEASTAEHEPGARRARWERIE